MVVYSGDRQQIDRIVHIAFEMPEDQDPTPGSAQQSNSDPSGSLAEALTRI